MICQNVLILHFIRMFEYEQKKYEHSSIEQCLADGCQGIKINCAGISCLFEFTVFRCKKFVPYQPPATTVSTFPEPALAKKPLKNEEISLSDDHQKKQDSNDTIDGGISASGGFSAASQSVDDGSAKLALGKAKKFKHRNKVECHLGQPLQTSARTLTEV